MPTLGRTADWERYRAAVEAAEAARHATFLRERPTVLIENQDVTEYVVSVLDALLNSLDMGSGFLDDDTIHATEELARLLKFDLRPVSDEEYDALRKATGLA